jgi:hypothetical protein
MAKKQLSRIESLINNLDESIKLAKEEYQTNPSNPLYSVIIDLELTIMEVKKIKKNEL